MANYVVLRTVTVANARNMYIENDVDRVFRGPFLGKY
jgi:hypothetical protein